MSHTVTVTAAELEKTADTLTATPATAAPDTIPVSVVAGHLRQAVLADVYSTLRLGEAAQARCGAQGDKVRELAEAAADALLAATQALEELREVADWAEDCTPATAPASAAA